MKIYKCENQANRFNCLEKTIQKLLCRVIDRLTKKNNIVYSFRFGDNHYTVKNISDDVTVKNISVGTKWEYKTKPNDDLLSNRIW